MEHRRRLPDVLGCGEDVDYHTVASTPYTAALARSSCGLSADLARPVVVGAVTGVRVVVAATGGLAALQVACLNAALADEPDRLQLCLEGPRKNNFLEVAVVSQ